ncbi:MAG: SpoIIE family protein phosphatase, partial [Prevotella sp.]|nr:SpoIIE family protein phosphatase [Prevotella sp.]
MMQDSVATNNKMCYASRDDDGTVQVKQYYGESAYKNRAYLKKIKTIKKDYWSNPYVDGDVKIATFSHPLTDSNGKLIGVLCADVLLDSISTFLQATSGTSNSRGLEIALNSLSEDSKVFILTKDGHFVISPDSTVNIDETYETYALRHKCPVFSSIGKTIIEENKGDQRVNFFDSFDMEGEEYLPSYSTISKVGWTVLTLHPTVIFYAIIMVFFVFVFVITFIGVILLVCIIYFVVRRSTSPLKRLVTASETIASGNFDVELPKVKHQDEVQTLTESFEGMRVSLKEYVAQLKETTAHNERMEQDLAIASHIQMSMLPETFPKPPEVPELSLFAYLKPTREVGGDLYDFFIRRGNLYFIVGDVSGKGVPAALIMSMIVSMFRARQRLDIAPERTVKALNNMLMERNSSDMFVTLIVGDLNLETGELYLCNAGHNPPI